MKFQNDGMMFFCVSSSPSIFAPDNDLVLSHLHKRSGRSAVPDGIQLFRGVSVAGGLEPLAGRRSRWHGLSVQSLFRIVFESGNVDSRRRNAGIIKRPVGRQLAVRFANDATVLRGISAFVGARRRHVESFDAFLAEDM